MKIGSGAAALNFSAALAPQFSRGEGWESRGAVAHYIHCDLGEKPGRILEMYLNTSEMGKGIFGIQSAAKNYFGKNAKQLTRSEAACIAAALPNPKVYSVKPMSRYVSGRCGWIMHQMNNLQNDPDIQKLIQ